MHGTEKICAESNLGLRSVFGSQVNWLACTPIANTSHVRRLVQVTNLVSQPAEKIHDL